MTGNDYRKKYNDINSELNRLENLVRDRFFYLINQYPNAPILIENNVQIYAKDIYNSIILGGEDGGVMFKIDIIIKIEKYISDQHPHKQLEINF